MIDPAQLRYLIAKTLRRMGLDSEAARELLMLIAAKESLLGTYLIQVGRGERVYGLAIGLLQMEPATYWDDLEWVYGSTSDRPDCVKFVAEFGATDLRAWSLNPLELDLQIGIARMHFRRIPEPLPDHLDIRGLAEYWHKHWCRGCRGTVEEAIHLYATYADPPEGSYVTASETLQGSITAGSLASTNLSSMIGACQYSQTDDPTDDSTDYEEEHSD
jgi:hypothetical protein